MKYSWFVLILLLSLTLSSCEQILQLEEILPSATSIVVEPQQPVETEVLPATQTPTPPPTETPVQTVEPLLTTEPSIQETDEPEATEVLQEDEAIVFDVQPGSPTRIKSWSYDCDWLGVAGQAFNLDGTPVESLIVEAGGSLDHQSILGLSLTGREKIYGPGGYEIQLLDRPITSTESIWIQLKDAAGTALSPKIYIDTVDDCEQNLVLMNFVASEVIPDTILFIPIMNMETQP